MTAARAKADTALVLVDLLNLFDFPGGDALGRATLGIAPRIAALRGGFDRADSCVLATAQDAHMRGYAQWVPSDCVAAISPARRDTALALLSRSIGIQTRGSRGTRGVFP